MIPGVLGAGGTSAAPAHPSGTSAAAPKVASQGQATTSILITTIAVPGTTLPSSVSFNLNITYGVISNATTKLWVSVNTSTPTAMFSTGNGSINSHNVTSFVNNGIPYESSNFTIALTEGVLETGTGGPACTDVSCSSFVGGFTFVTYTISVIEFGAQDGGGGGYATQGTSWVSTLQSTYAGGSYFSSPITEQIAFNFTAAFDVNVSYLAFGTNPDSVLNVSLNLTFYGPVVTLYANLTLNGTIGTSNLWGGASTIVSNGTSYDGYWADVSYTVVVNATNLGVTDWTTFADDVGTGGELVLTAWYNASGASAGGFDPGINAAAVSAVEAGTVTINGGVTDAPVSYQPAPYTQTGWLNLTWVGADYQTSGNASLGGFLLLGDLTSATILEAYSLNDSVNTTNPSGVSFTPVTNGTVFGQSWVNYSWSVTITTAAVAGSSYGDLLAMYVSLYANGSAVLPANEINAPIGINVTISGLLFGPTAFAEHPTVASAVYTTPITGFIDVSTVPYDLNFTISVTNGTITPATTSVVVSVVDATIPAPIYNYSLPVTPGQTQYTLPITEQTVTQCNASFWIPGTGGDSGVPLTPVCPYTSPTDDFYFTLNVTENGIGAPTNGTMSTYFTSIGPAFFIGTAATISLVAPTGTNPYLSVGNISFATLYAGQYVSGANLTVYSGTTVVFSALMTQLVTGVPATAVWPATAAGTYSLVVVMTRTSGGPVYVNETLTLVTGGGGTVYQNSSTYHNVTLLGSLSPAVAGTILLLVGLIVGMIVALLVGRMMWGGSKPQEPPQQWEQGTSGTSASGTEATSGTGTGDSGGGATSDGGTPPSGGTS